jgi:hypothetical protein
MKPNFIRDGGASCMPPRFSSPQNTKAGLPFRQPGCLFARPVAFRPHLAMGLAFSKDVTFFHRLHRNASSILKGMNWV